MDGLDSGLFGYKVVSACLDDGCDVFFQICDDGVGLRISEVGALLSRDVKEKQEVVFVSEDIGGVQVASGHLH